MHRFLTFVALMVVDVILTKNFPDVLPLAIWFCAVMIVVPIACLLER
jgi:hypothetical protein